MIISVTSPVHGQAGNTTIALLISLLLSKHKTVCLTHLSANSSSFFTYLGLQSLADPTCTPSQMVNLLRVGSINQHDMKDYCMKVNDNLDIFSNKAKSFTDEDMELTAKYITENMPHEIIVLDIDINTALPLAQFAFEKSALVIISMTQMLNVFERFNEVFGDSESIKNKAIYLCNHFTQEVGSVSTFAKQLKVKNRKCSTLHHSETLMKLSNNGKLSEIIPLAKSIPLPDFTADLERLERIILDAYKNQSKVIESEEVEQWI